MDCPSYSVLRGDVSKQRKHEVIERIKKISNPLTAISAFAVFAEVACAIALPRLEGNVQSVFVWFVILFPTILVILFFLTLNFNPKVLYAPSDFANEEHFVKLIEKGIEQSPKISNIEEEVQPLIRQALEDDEPDFPKQAPDKDDKEQIKLKPDELRILRVLKEGRYVYRSATGLAKEVLNSNRNLTKDILFNLKEMGAVGERKKGENHRYFITDEGRRLLKHYRE